MVELKDSNFDLRDASSPSTSLNAPIVYHWTIFCLTSNFM